MYAKTVGIVGPSWIGRKPTKDVVERIILRSMNENGFLEETAVIATHGPGVALVAKNVAVGLGVWFRQVAVRGRITANVFAEDCEHLAVVGFKDEAELDDNIRFRADENLKNISKMVAHARMRGKKITWAPVI